jgi:small conductance mechanosensitive channel
MGAIAAYIVGRMLIGFASRLVTNAFERQKVEPTITRYIGSLISIALNVILVVAILGYFGVETTSFAALIAGLGLAVGAAWAGSVQFRCRALILVLRPFKVGDYVVAGEVEGMCGDRHVQHRDRYASTMCDDGRQRQDGRTIKNFSANPYRRVDLTAQLDHTVDPSDAIRRPLAAEDRQRRRRPRPTSRSFRSTSAAGPRAARCNTAHYWQVYLTPTDDTRDVRRRRLSRGRGAHAHPPQGGTTQPEERASPKAGSSHLQPAPSVYLNWKSAMCCEPSLNVSVMSDTAGVTFGVFQLNCQLPLP